MGVFYGSDIMNDLRIAYWIDVLKALIQGNPCLLRNLILDNRLVLIGENFGDYVFYFANCFIVLIFFMQHCIYDDIWF